MTPEEPQRWPGLRTGPPADVLTAAAADTDPSAGARIGDVAHRGTRRVVPGAGPALAIQPGSSGSARQITRSRCYRDGVLTDEGFPLADVSEHLEDESSVVWVDLCAPGPEDLEVIADELGLHTLAVEAATSGRQRPKFERFPGHDFLNAYAVRVDVTAGELVTGEIAAFITSNALVTVRKDDEVPIDGLVACWDANADLNPYGIGALVHGLLDFVVDGHFEAVESLDEQIEQLEDLLFNDRVPQDRDVQRRSFELRKSLAHLRRVVLPMREVVNSLMRRDVGLVPEQLMPHYQDVYDHVLRATEWTESLRDLVTTIVETNLTNQGNRLNIITKKVTSWAAIIAVPTAITGFYGQNVPYPGFARGSGFITSSVLIVLMSGVLYLAFRRKDWL